MVELLLPRHAHPLPPTMDSLTTHFLSHFSPSHPKLPPLRPKATSFRPVCSISADPWTLSDGNPAAKPRPFKKNQKKPLSDDNARRIVHAKARYLSQLRKNQGSHAQTPKWIRRTPEQMEQWLRDDRSGHLYGKHVVAAIRTVRGLAARKEGSYDMREVMGGFVARLTFKEMCIVLKEQKGWRQARDFFAWMKLQLCFRPSAVVYTIVLRIYGQVGKIRLAEQVFLEMLEAGCEPDEVACGTMLCTYARWGRHKEMLSFYSAVLQRDITPPISVFNFMISSLQKLKLHKKVIQLWRQMILSNVEPNHFTYTVVICSYAKEGLLSEAFDTFNKMKSFNYIPEEVTYSLLISLFAKDGNQDEAFKLYEDMKSQRIVPSNYTFSSLLNLHYKNGDFSKAMSLFSEIRSYNVVLDEVIYGILIKIYGKIGQYDEAERTFMELEQMDLLHDEKTYVAMAQVHLSRGDSEKALNVFHRMKLRNVQLSKFAYNALLQCYASIEDISAAEATFQAHSKAETPDAWSFCALLNLYVKMGLHEKAKMLICQMEKEQIHFDEELYKATIRFYCKECMVNEAEKSVEEMRKHGFHVNKFTLASLISMYGECRDLKKAEGIFKTLEQPDPLILIQMICLYLENGKANNAQPLVALLVETSSSSSIIDQHIKKFIREGHISRAEFLYDQIIQLGLRLEDTTAAALIDYYGKEKEMRKAEEVFGHAAKSAFGKSLLVSMTDAYVSCGNLDKAHQVYSNISQDGHHTDAVATSVVVNALTNHGRYQEAESIIRNSFQSSMELDTVAFNTYIKAMLMAGKLHFAANIYSRMIDSGIAPSIQTYCTMISVYGRGKNLDKAVEMFDMACRSGLTVDEKTYTNMIVYYGKAGMIKEASHLFKKMQEGGITPGKFSYNTMINVYAVAGHHLEAVELFNNMQKNRILPDSYTYLSLIRACTESQNFQRAEEILLSMKTNGVNPTCAHFNLLLSAYVRDGLISEAERVFHKLKSSNLRPDLESHRLMMRGYMDYGHIEEGISLFEQTNKSIKPDNFILSAAVHLYEFIGMKHEARNFLDTMNQEGIRFLDNLQVGAKMKMG